MLKRKKYYHTLIAKCTSKTVIAEKIRIKKRKKKKKKKD